MRDRFDAEIWNGSHDQFSEWFGGALRGAAGALRRGAISVRVPVQFAAAVAAVSLSGLSLGAVFV